MAYGGTTTFAIVFFFWMISFEKSALTSKIYIVSSLAFGGLYGFYITASTIIYQFQAIKTFTPSEDNLELSEIWGSFGVYLGT